MTDVILNLDYGSFFTKATWKWYESGRESHPSAPYALTGTWDGVMVQPDPSLQLDSHRSLKEAFLTGRISREDLLGHRSQVLQDLERTVFPGVDRHLKACGITSFDLLANIHAPLRLDQTRWLADAKLFRITSDTKRLMAPRYRELAETREEFSLATARPEVLWGDFLADCIGELGGRLGPASIRVAAIPESLTAVNRMVESFDRGQNRQFLIMDIGHFTTDYALVAYDSVWGDRFLAKVANSIYEAGSRLIESSGQQAWLARIGQELTTLTSAEQRPFEYMDLAVVLIGGGATALGVEARSQLVDTVRTWACQNALFHDRSRDNPRSVVRDEPCLPDDLLDPLRGGSALPTRWGYAQLPLHVPSLVACMDARDFRGLHFPDPSLDRAWSKATAGEPAPNNQYPFRPLDGWTQPAPGVKCPHCPSVFPNEAILKAHIFQSHPSMPPAVAYHSARITSGQRIKVSHHEDLAGFTFRRWTRASMKVDAQGEEALEPSQEPALRQRLAALPNSAFVQFRFWNGTGNLTGTPLAFDLELTVNEPAELAAIDRQFLDLLEKQRGPQFCLSLARAVPPYCPRGSLAYWSALNDFAMAMEMKDDPSGADPGNEKAAMKLREAGKGLAGIETPLARILEGLCAFNLAQTRELTRTTGHPGLDAALARLRGFMGQGAPLPPSPPAELIVAGLLDRCTQSLLTAFTQDAETLVLATQAGQNRESLGSPKLWSDRAKADVILAWALLERSRIEAARVILTRLGIGHPLFGGWVAQSLRRMDA